MLFAIPAAMGAINLNVKNSRTTLQGAVGQQNNAASPTGKIGYLCKALNPCALRNGLFFSD